jgi:ABC-type sugar transport system ATPase subunit
MLHLDRVSKCFPGGVQALRELSLDVRNGEHVVLVGPSGCGKTTTLRLVAGLESPTAGRIEIDGRDATRLPPHRRDVALVFQDATLYPHLSVRDNLAFGLRLRHAQPALIEKRVHWIASDLGLLDLLDRPPGQLSGGQKRRVALGRALVRGPRYLLLDEPLAGLDPPARQELRRELARLHAEGQTTILHVTHDQEEALGLGDRVGVLRDGGLQQIDTPMSLHDRPANVFVAMFIGSPPMNVFTWVHGGEPCFLGVRPRDIRIVAWEGSDVPAIVEIVQPLGHETHLQLRVATSSSPVIVGVTGPVEARRGDRVGLQFEPEKSWIFDAETRLAVKRV